jgi:hypothetical protein
MYKDSAGKDFNIMAITLYNRMNKPITIKNMDIEIKNRKRYEIFDALIEEKSGFEFNLENGKIRLLPTVTLEPNGFERIIIDYSNKLKEESQSLLRLKKDIFVLINGYAKIKEIHLDLRF